MAAKNDERLPIRWRGQQVGVLVGPRVDMFWLYGGWEPAAGPVTEEFLSAIEAGDELVVTVGDANPVHMVVAALDEGHIELKNQPSLNQ
ncbi:hypothetical protein HPC49_29190 [Pyxidicoccus fallax]|uniref:Uncharacterized protein n=1 Tax=Pyxidicoccus fallax TaxID=394095 RepID=A0A848LJE6_9BACT|nr:hypothetical protein [Pyxidicoccus fallax]NMO17840.1 hypothetical protein [Pyxidicoccus fallax]NPC82281.1 hypothetical protein [Pyxidicoccus fallax]